MKIVITGSEGQLGRELMKLYPTAIGASHCPSKANYLPIEHPPLIEKFLKEVNPDIVINAAALTNVDMCEREKKYAYQVNALAVRAISVVCNDIGARLVQISTDYVFDGLDGNYLEDSPPNPVNYYGLTKLSGEQFALANENNTIVRTSGVFGYSNNFPLFVYNKLKNKEPVNAIKGYYSPIHAKNLALAIQKLISFDFNGEIINVAGDRISRFELALRIAEYFNFDNDLVKESEQITNMQAKRPFDSSLNIENAKSLIDFDFYSIKTNLYALKESISSTEKIK